jgi:uncharacterized protein YjbI with pentapeptide repeats
MSLIDHKKEKIEDKEFSGDVSGGDYSRKEIYRVFAVSKTFTDVNFSQSNLNSCYFRNCRFVRCNFTGTSFKECYLKGASFPESSLKYTTFSSSHLDGAILDNSLPAEENLARDLVRALRVNFAQVGNYEAVNKAASIEVKLTGIHLYKAAYSRESYYRGKEHYSGFGRVKAIFLHARWKFLDLLWGNGESLFKIIMSSLAFVILMSLVVCLSSSESFGDILIPVFYVFWGVKSGLEIASPFTLVLTVFRLLFFSLFVSVLVKRLAKR